MSSTHRRSVNGCVVTYLSSRVGPNSGLLYSSVSSWTGNNYVIRLNTAHGAYERFKDHEFGRGVFLHMRIPR